MMDRLFRDANVPLLEKMVRFTTARQKVLAEDVVNLSTPGYHNKDLSLSDFRHALAKQANPNDASTSAEAKASEPKETDDGILFHDRNNRNVEQLMADQASNALLHNMSVELLRKQFSEIQEALKEHVT